MYIYLRLKFDGSVQCTQMDTYYIRSIPVSFISHFEHKTPHITQHKEVHLVLNFVVVELGKTTSEAQNMKP